ncbi:glycosyltransferase [Paenibacillus sp. Y412MC10]|uniref:glycosyltransferase n=1 Tax=Geobacillus sp. (strain Y412MC10) TaxID=481743 RepID=UPI0001787F8F|nr:glycosyltransferase [Paenibacillus sp. Y412MC10]ACX64890.1 glycosyl transferase family 2 [Paenibacillus sp. Y412MC10]
MAASFNNSSKTQGVSIITCTNRPNYIKNLFHNFARQSHAKKELIIVVNDSTIALSPYQQIANKHRNIQIYRMPEHVTLGACLNYAVSKTKYGIVAKFDDDDYYAPHYLSDSLKSLRRSNADIIGKRAHYMYLQGSKTLILRFPNDETRTVTMLPGATLIFKKNVFNKVRFPNQNVGEDDLFCTRSKSKGFKVYSGNKYHFTAVRRKNSSGHTWIISDQELMAKHPKVPNVRDFKKFVQRTTGGSRA